MMTDDDIYAPEELHPELKKRVFASKSFDVLQHPLVFSVPYNEFTNKILNKSLAYKKQAVAEAQEQGDWHRYVFLHERPFRFDALRSVEDKFTDDKEYWRVVGSVWTDSENIYQHFAVWKRLWASSFNGRDVLMDEEEKEVLEAMPQVLTVYRGFKIKKSERGLSWTTDRDTAVWFARRFRASHQSSFVAQANVAKKDVLAYFDGRNEKEVVVLPTSLKNLLSERVE
jgi:hypothetical protein